MSDVVLRNIIYHHYPLPPLPFYLVSNRYTTSITLMGEKRIWGQNFIRPPRDRLRKIYGGPICKNEPARMYYIRADAG